MSDRSWAVGLTQDQFLQEFMRRMPLADAVPLQSEYAAGEDPIYKGIDGVSPDDLMAEHPKVSPNMQKTDEKSQPPVKKYACRGCGSAFDFAIARAGHERGCKAKLQKVEDK